MIPELFDTHTHLCDPVFDRDREQLISRAKEAGVSGIISVSEHLADARRNIELSSIHPEIFPAAGLYPTCLDIKQAENMHAFIRENRSRLAAIGEVGLDFWAGGSRPART